MNTDTPRTMTPAQINRRISETCGCDVDWTAPCIYALEAEVADLKQALEIANRSADDQMFQKREAEAEVEKLCRELAEARSLIIESKKMHDYIRKLLSFVYMELPAHENTKKFVHQYFNEIQS